MSTALQPTIPTLTSELTCPHCSRRHMETMPEDACIYFFECQGCGAMLKPKSGDCCVFCSYGSVPCPPIQVDRAGGASATSCCR
ncbi:MAG: GDCCVxC domain-containing (seleno)protein [Steroidobacteraceae bacterium]